MAADHREPVEGNSHYLPPLHLAYKKTVVIEILSHLVLWDGVSLTLKDRHVECLGHLL